MGYRGGAGGALGPESVLTEHLAALAVTRPKADPLILVPGGGQDGQVLAVVESVPTWRDPSLDPFGDGSDGDLEILQGEVLLEGKALWQFASLILGPGTWLKTAGWNHGQPVVEIRCRTPIVLNGCIHAGYSAWWTGTEWAGQPALPGECGMPPILGTPGGSFPILPIAGGGHSHVTLLLEDVPPFPYVDWTSAGDPKDILVDPDYDFRHLVGPGRPYRFCAGCMSGYGDDGTGGSGEGGKGGGILLIHAPSIVFGEVGYIFANGESAQGFPGSTGGEEPEEDGHGHGGGGGYVEIATRTPLTEAQRDHVQAEGGSGFGEGGHGGLPGVSVFVVVP